MRTEYDEHQARRAERAEHLARARQRRLKRSSPHDNAYAWAASLYGIQHSRPLAMRAKGF